MIIQGEAPLSFDDIVKLVSGEATSYSIDYNKSTLRGRELLIYLTNLDLDIDIEFSNSKLDISIMLYSYFNSDVACKVPILDRLAAAVLLEYKGLDHKFLFPNLPFNKEDMRLFIKNNEGVLYKASMFLDSFPLFMQKTIIKLDEMLKLEEVCEVIDDKKYVTNNIATIIEIGGFIDYYLSSKSPIKCFYFKRQFEDYMFNGKNLYDCLLNSKSVTYGMFLGVLSNEIDVESLRLTREVADGFEAG